MANQMCGSVLDQRIRFILAFGYFHLIDDHPYLFKYNKREYMIYGPEETFRNDEITYVCR